VPGGIAIMTAVPRNQVHVRDDRRESSNRIEYLMLFTGTLFVLTAVVLAVVLR
jgi:hypothetical protein